MRRSQIGCWLLVAIDDGGASFAGGRRRRLLVAGGRLLLFYWCGDDGGVCCLVVSVRSAVLVKVHWFGEPDNADGSLLIEGIGM